MIACTSFESTARSTPRTISVPSSVATCRFLISSRAKSFVGSYPVTQPFKRGRSGHAQCSDCALGRPGQVDVVPRSMALRIGTGKSSSSSCCSSSSAPSGSRRWAARSGTGMREFKDAVHERRRARRRSSTRRPRRRPPRPRPRRSSRSGAAARRPSTSSPAAMARLPRRLEARRPRHARRAPRRVSLAPDRLDPRRHRRRSSSPTSSTTTSSAGSRSPSPSTTTASSSRSASPSRSSRPSRSVFYRRARDLPAGRPLAALELPRARLPGELPAHRRRLRRCSPPCSSPPGVAFGVLHRPAARPRLPDHLQRRVLPDRDPGELLLLVRRVHAARYRARLPAARSSSSRSSGSACSRRRLCGGTAASVSSSSSSSRSLLPTVDPVSLVFETIPLLVLFEARSGRRCSSRSAGASAA